MWKGYRNSRVRGRETVIGSIVRDEVLVPEARRRSSAVGGHRRPFMVATSAFYRLTCSLAAGAGGEACMEAPVQGDLPRFQIQPPSCHSAAAGTGGGGGAAIGSDLAVLPGR